MEYNYKKITIDSYNKNAKDFSKKFKKLTNISKRYEFERFMDLLKGDKILDAGCGSGDHSIYFKNRGLKVTSIDLSESMVDLCNKKGINAKVMDIENLDFKEKSFDGIWMVTSLLHVPKIKIKKIIDKLSLILKEDGILYICVKEGKGERFITDKDKSTKRFFSFWGSQELISLLKDHFFIIEFKKEKLGNSIFLEFFFSKK